MEPIKTLIVDGVEHDIGDFSPAIQNLVTLRQQWMEEAVNERNKVVKTEAAIRQLETELSNMVQAELSSKNKKEDTPQEQANDDQG